MSFLGLSTPFPALRTTNASKVATCSYYSTSFFFTQNKCNTHKTENHNNKYCTFSRATVSSTGNQQSAPSGTLSSLRSTHDTSFRKNLPFRAFTAATTSRATSSFTFRRVLVVYRGIRSCTICRKRMFPSNRTREAPRPSKTSFRLISLISMGRPCSLGRPLVFVV